jgi:hypothetical protein
MGVRSHPLLIGLAGLLFPGLGQFLNGQKLKGLLFFVLANLLLFTALPLLFIKLRRALELIPAGTPERWVLLKRHLEAGGLDFLLFLGAAYGGLLLAAAGSAYYTARKMQKNLLPPDPRLCRQEDGGSEKAPAANPDSKTSGIEKC